MSRHHARPAAALAVHPVRFSIPHFPAALPSPRRGFTLLELLVVLVIVGLLAGFVGPRLFAQVGRSEAKAARAQMAAFEKALDQYRLDTGHYPGSDAGLAALSARPADEPRWLGPYLAKAVPADPWGRPYGYRAPGQHGEYDLWSLGKDGREGGEGDDADIANW
jgi:general secretion pathway protein G